MTWLSEGAGGAILYPAGPDTIPDFGWSSGAFAGGAGWTAAGDVLPTLATGYGEVVGSCLSVTPFGGTSYAWNATLRDWAWETPADDPFYLYLHAAALSGDAGTLRLRVEYHDGGGLLGTDDLDVALVDELFVDGVQRLFRSDALSPPAGVTKYRLLVGATGGTDAYQVMVDFAYFGHAVDLQDMAPPPVQFDAPMEDKVRQDRTSNVAEDGEVEVTRFAQLDGAPGYRTGAFNAAYFDDDGLAMVDRAWPFLAGHDGGASRAFTLVGQPYDLSRNFVAKARLVNPKRGVVRLESSGLHSWQQAWEELRWEVRAGVGRDTAAGDVVLVVEFEGLIDGTDSLFLASGPVLSGIDANLLHVLKRDTVQRSEQRYDPKTFETTFPEYTFACVDDGLVVSQVLEDNAEWLDRCVVKIWRGDDLMDFAAFDRKWIGRYAEPERSDGLLTFTSVSAFSDTDYPIQPITGAAELAADVTDPTALTITLRNVVGLNRDFPNLLLNPGFEAALGAEWKDDVAPVAPPAGTLAATSAGVLLRSTLLHEEGLASLRDSSSLSSHVWYYRYQEVDVNLLNIYDFAGFVNSDGNDDADGGIPYGGGEFCLIIEEYDASDVLLNSYTTGAVPRPRDYVKLARLETGTDLQFEIWVNTGLAYTPANDASYVRVFQLLRHGGAAGTSSRHGAFDNMRFQQGVLMRWDNEISAVTSLSEAAGASSGVATLAARGMFGSLPKRHTASSTAGSGTTGQGSGGQCLFYNRYSGHFLDILRRLLTTTRSTLPLVAWTPNGPYDDGSGVGLGRYFDASWLGPGWDTEKTYASAGDGPINSYDHSRYLMDFTFDAKIESFKDMAVNEVLLPMATVWFIDDTGALDVVILREREAGGGGTVLPRDVMNDGKLVFDLAPLEEVVNTLYYRFDHDPMGANDVQGSTVGPTPFITERPYTEKEMGDEDTPSLARFQERPLYFDVRGLRGFGSVQFGLSWAYHGDRTAYERARVWLTRQRFRVPQAEVSLALRKEGLHLGDSLDVTSAAMVVGGTMGRTASKMSVRSLTGPDYSTGLMTAVLAAHGDLPEIENTEVAAAMPAPDKDDWTLMKRPGTNSPTNTLFDHISVGFRKARVYVRGFCNLASIALQYDGAAPPTAPVDAASPQIPDYMMTRVYGSPKLLLATDLAAVYYTNPAEGQVGTIKTLTAWSSGTTYPLGKVVLRGTNGLVYRSLQSGNLNHAPESNLSAWWELYPATDDPADYGSFAGGTTYPIDAVVISSAIAYKSLQAANVSHTPASSPTWWKPVTLVSDYQVVTEMRAPLAEENVMFSSGNNTALSGTGADTGSTKKQLMFVRIAYVNDDWVEGDWSDCKVVAGANFVDDLGDRMYRGKLMQTITGSDGRTRTSWGSGRT